MTEIKGGRENGELKREQEKIEFKSKRVRKLNVKDEWVPAPG